MTKRNGENRGVRRLALGVAALLVTIAALNAHPLLRLDGVGGLLWTILLQTDTEYAPGYSHRGFLKLARGMTNSEMVALVGEPLEKKVTGSVEHWWYSRSPGSTHYRFRLVILDAGVVEEISSEFYAD